MHIFINLFYKLYMNLVIGPLYSLKGKVFSHHRTPIIPESETCKTVVITGGSRGIGLAAVRKLLNLKCRVIIGCRAVDETRTALANTEDISLVTILHLDLMKMDTVRHFAKQVLDLNVPIHCLVNNAGIMFGKKRITEDGFESQLATNYLGHFLLSHLLLPKLEESGSDESPARIVNVASCAHYICWSIDTENLNSAKLYTPELAYGMSKSAQVMFSQYLDSFTSPRIRVFALHPGVIMSDLFQEVKWMIMLGKVLHFLLKTVEQGADSLIHAALSPELKQAKTEGFYLDNSQLCRISSCSASISNQSKLWDKTCSMLNISKFGENN